MTEKSLKKLKAGDFNRMDQQWQEDGSVIITLAKDGDKTTHKFRVRDLYGENEELLDIETGKPLKKK